MVWEGTTTLRYFTVLGPPCRWYPQQPSLGHNPQPPGWQRAREQMANGSPFPPPLLSVPASPSHSLPISSLFLLCSPASPASPPSTCHLAAAGSHMGPALGCHPSTSRLAPRFEDFILNTTFKSSEAKRGNSKPPEGGGSPVVSTVRKKSLQPHSRR